MSDLVKLTGMVLRSQPIAEYDKRLVLLTRERGKIAAFAKGARRQGSPLMAGCRTFATGEFFCYEGRTSYTVRSAEPVRFFEDLALDMEKACYASYFAEIADYYSREGLDERERLVLLYQALRALETESLPDRLVRCIYELKTMVINGEYTVEPPRPVSESARYALEYIAATPCEKLFTFTLKDAVLAEVEGCLAVYRDRFFEHDFRSMEILEEMAGLSAQAHRAENGKK
ncbi:MAG: DNA repair protein RecO [Lachnospiraceae bacterium]|nr:DNA repair protein RecO [Lachnospiraceae bacterium]